MSKGTYLNPRSPKDEPEEVEGRIIPDARELVAWAVGLTKRLDDQGYIEMEFTVFGQTIPFKIKMPGK